MSNKVTVVARDLTKTYYLTKSGSRRGIARSNSRIEVKALRGVSLIAQAGESIGVVGQNGSGKSTLFRLLAGGESPTSGTVRVSAQPTLLGVGAALQPNLSGFTNIRLGLLAMGLHPSEVEELQYEVAEWADIGDALHRPLSTYSSGMRSRLTFSISTAVRREILLVDEALATGDQSFMSRAKKRMNSFLDGAGTVFLVSHGAGTIQEYCTRAIWLHEGRIIADGDAAEVTRKYVRWSKRLARGDQKGANQLMQRTVDTFKPQRVLFDSEAIAFLDKSAYNNEL